MKRELQIKRHFSASLRKESVKEFESGKATVSQLSRIYCASVTSIYKWIHKYGTFDKQSIQIVEMKSSDTARIRTLLERVKELEQIVGQKQITLDFYQKMIQLAEKEYDIAIEKNFSTLQSTTLEKTNKK